MNGFKQQTRTLLCAVGIFASALLSACGGGGDQGRDPILGVPGTTLVSVAVTPATASVAAGFTQQFVATATYSDNSSRIVTTEAAWASANPAVATVVAATGVARGVTTGTTNISATLGGKSGAAALTVTPAVLVSMQVAPVNTSISAGINQQFTAMGTFSDASTRDITAATTFASSLPAVATINASTGVARGVTAGTTVITASSGTSSASTNLTVTALALVSVQITPVTPTVQIGSTRQMFVTARYSDLSTVNVTGSSTYVSGSPAVATINANGILTGVSAGNALVTGTFNGMSSSTLANVPSATITSIAVTPAAASVAVGNTRQFTATATYSDASTGNVTNSALWTSSNPLVATVLPTGVARGVATGVANITATVGANAGFGVLTVTAAPVVPAPGTINLGNANTFGVLAGTSITNNAGGLTLVTGDVGAPSQTTDPVQTAGYSNYKSGAPLATALADLQLAITDANSRVCTVTSAAGINLGGLTLTPGVYCYGGAITLTGTFTMNGPGLYIFRTASTLNTSANSVVQLINGAAASNAFWVPAQATTLGANSFFKGTIMAQSAAITLNDMVDLQMGRVLSGAAVTLTNNRISIID
ncbi:MAG: Ig-like domain-containing protein [Pseudomonadota bacterium]